MDNQIIRPIGERIIKITCSLSLEIKYDINISSKVRTHSYVSRVVRYLERSVIGMP